MCSPSEWFCIARDTEHWNDYAFAAWQTLQPCLIWLTLIVLVSLLVWGGRPSRRSLRAAREGRWFWRAFSWGGWVLLLYYLVLLPRIGQLLERLTQESLRQESQLERIFLERTLLERDRHLNHPLP